MMKNLIYLLFFIPSLVYSQGWVVGQGNDLSPTNKNFRVQKSFQVGDGTGTDTLFVRSKLFVRSTAAVAGTVEYYLFDSDHSVDFSIVPSDEVLTVHDSTTSIQTVRSQTGNTWTMSRDSAGSNGDIAMGISGNIAYLGTNSVISITSGGTMKVDIPSAANNLFLKSNDASGTATFSLVSLTSSVTGTLGATNGGTGQATWTTGDLLYASAANTLSKRAIGSTGDVLTVSGGVPTWATPSGGFPSADTTIDYNDTVTVSSSKHVVVNGAGTGVTKVNLWAAPLNTVVIISDRDNKSSANNIVIDAGTGKNISGTVTQQTFTMNSNGMSITMQKVSVSIWKIMMIPFIWLFRIKKAKVI